MLATTMFCANHHDDEPRAPAPPGQQVTVVAAASVELEAFDEKDDDDEDADADDAGSDAAGATPRKDAAAMLGEVRTSSRSKKKHGAKRKAAARTVSSTSVNKEEETVCLLASELREYLDGSSYCRTQCALMCVRGASDRSWARRVRQADSRGAPPRSLARDATGAARARESSGSGDDRSLTTSQVRRAEAAARGTRLLAARLAHLRRGRLLVRDDPAAEHCVLGHQRRAGERFGAHERRERARTVHTSGVRERARRTRAA